MASIESYTKKGIDSELDKKSDKTHKLEDHPDWPSAISSVVKFVEDPPGSGLYTLIAGDTGPT